MKHGTLTFEGKNRILKHTNSLNPNPSSAHQGDRKTGLTLTFRLLTKILSGLHPNPNPLNSKPLLLHMARLFIVL